MTLHVLGSVNIDHVYRVPHAPGPGETLADQGYARGLGGKGANQALAAARAGAAVRFVGAIGADGGWTRHHLASTGVAVDHLAQVSEATGHAVILVEPCGENRIIIHGGANRALPASLIDAALSAARPGDWWLSQNETTRVHESFVAARAAGLRTAYAAAPFDAAAAEAVLDGLDLLALNEGEAAALETHLGQPLAALPVTHVLLTLGAQGARLISGAPGARTVLEVPAFPVTPIDTTGAGDCFLGVALAGLDHGLEAAEALRRAAAAAAIQVTRPGAAGALPDVTEIDAFLAERA
ncbi:MAG: PfkB family carbohydrate kinase [Pseudomonadota bacterium]